MHQVQCRQCGITAVIYDGTDVHTALDSAGCVCCKIDHHHGEAANACSGSSSTPGDWGHGDTPCWDGVGDRHPDCEVCRPVLITGLAIALAPVV
jgi:hypothetical protein